MQVAADPLFVEAANLSTATATAENLFSDEQNIKTEEMGEDPLSIVDSEDCSPTKSKTKSHPIGIGFNGYCEG